MNIFVVEDSAVMCNILQSMLSDISDVTLIGQAADELSAVSGIDALLPDVVILDLNLEQGSGIGVLEHIKKLHAGIKVIVLTHSTDDFYFNRCKSIGADYLFDKSFQFTRVRAALGHLACTGRMDRKFDA